MELTLVNDNGDTQREQALGSELLWDTNLLECSPGGNLPASGVGTEFISLP